MYDFHIHSDFSIDSQSSMEDMVLGAIDQGLKSICFTDHIDLETTSQSIDIQFRVEDYLRNIKRVKYRYMNQIEILSGVELGMQAHLKARYEKILEEGIFDFVIMSIHQIKDIDISPDKTYHDDEASELLKLYYNEMYKCVKVFDDFDVLGHMDFIDRYIYDKNNFPNYNEHYEIIAEILKVIIDKGKGIELNTSGLRHDLNYFYPKLTILELYKDLGGEILTIGSDAHEPQYVGYKYRLAEKLLKDLAFRYIYVFKNRKKFPIQIG